MKSIFVAGVIANKHRSAGAIWTRLNWTLGLRQLGFEVFFVEQIAPEACVDSAGQPAAFAESANLATFRRVLDGCGLADHAALLCGDEHFGIAPADLLARARAAEALINISGHLTDARLLQQFRRKVYIDLDPGFTQIWQATGVAGARLEGHDFHFTIGENIGQPDCAIPTNGLHWRPICQPVVLDLWPVTEAPARPRFTTIASWRGPYGPLEFGGQTLGVKAHEWRKFLELPQRCGTACEFEIALDIHPADGKDLHALREHGWSVVAPSEVAGDLESVQRYVRESRAEFSVAQGVYVGTNSGWVSDRTVCYLATGRPTLVQQTGFSRSHPAEAGLVPFRTLDEAVAGAGTIIRDSEFHRHVAREIAERDFDSDKVLGRLVEQIRVVR